MNKQIERLQKKVDELWEEILKLRKVDSQSDELYRLRKKRLRLKQKIKRERGKLTVSKRPEPLFEVEGQQ